jgi:hypothetical protein
MILTDEMVERAATELLRYNRMIPLGQYVSDAPTAMAAEARDEARAVLLAALSTLDE